MTGPPFTILSVCKGGGYRYCRTDPPHPKANAKGLYPLHRVLAENREGRILDTDELVHHDDEDPTNDDVGNLVVVERAEHGRLHHPEGPDEVDTCAQCGGPIVAKPSVLRTRRKHNAGGVLCCSRSCSVKRQHAIRAWSEAWALSAA